MATIRNKFSEFYIQSGLVALSILVVLVAVFYPGYMSPDSISHLEQATGAAHLTDWHPPVMTRFWGLLISMSGYVSLMLIFQLLLIVIAMFILSALVYKYTHCRAWSLSVYAILLLPNIVNIAGVIWKDVQMAFSLALAVLLMWLVISSRKSLGRVAKLLYVGLTLLLVIYAGMLRYNALFAVIPILFVLPGLLTKRLAVWGGIVFAIVGLTIIIGTTTVINEPSEKTHPITAVQLDDIIHIASLEEGSRGRWAMYREIYNTCRSTTKDIMNSYILCTTASQRDMLREEHQGVFSDWMSTILKHPIKYALYRMSTFLVFLFPQPERMYIFQPGIEQNQLGVAVKNDHIISGLSAYVKGGAQANVPMIFQPWLYLVVLVYIYYKSGRVQERTQRRFIRAIALSGLIYILAYIPMAVAVDYRYIYWSVFAAILSGLLTVLLGQPRRRSDVHE